MNELKTIKPNRRTMVSGLASIPLAKILADPALAAAVADTLEEVTTTTASGREVTAYLAVPDVTPAPALILIHEWWGLRDENKSIAAEYAKEGFLALAIDLFKGESTDKVMEAVKQSTGLVEEEANETCVAWAEWLRNEPRSTGKLGTIGWCFGGKWSLNTSILAPVDATVIYYGRVDRSLEDLAKLKGDVLGHFGTLDKFIPVKMVNQFEANLNELGKTNTIHWYEADHAFSNATGENYVKEASKVAWGRTVEFVKEQLMEDASPSGVRGFFKRIADFFSG